jgi:hypothetical protein
MEQHAGYIDESLVRAKAYELWLQRGCPQGSSEDDWYQAEQLLRTEPQAPSVAAKEPASTGLVLEQDASTPTARTVRRRA